ncbi:hepatic and glial cell adhesion molecule-like isoform X5 [Melanerpes formicivorus]|uniref:hepatic and glial cell adhesion molecule-like isoform X5 n=1 Tax=Melanerpes formicivorus TaxID=211600 RepID=UPI00358FA43A
MKPVKNSFVTPAALTLASALRLTPPALPSLCFPALLLSLQVSPSVVEITEKQLAAVGSSVLLRAPSIGNANLTDWEVVRRGTSHLILQYYANVQAPTIYPAYQGRVVFYPENGSMLLQRLQETDSGIYVATVDLMHDKARTILLEVIKPVSQPELQSSSNLAGSSIELLCVVPEGMVASISWKKDGHPLPPEKLCLLSENNTLLQIRSGGKSDCGSYSCNISNEISWKEATTSLVVTGLTPALLHLQRLSVVTLIFIASSAIGFLTLLCWPREPSRGNKARKRVRVSSYVLLCVSSVLLFAISISWMHEEGLSAAFLLLGLFFFGAAIGSAWAAAALLWRPAARSRLKAHVSFPSPRALHHPQLHSLHNADGQPLVHHLLVPQHGEARRINVLAPTCPGAGQRSNS